MHRLVCPFILDRYADGESAGQFQAASLFVDMSGFSAMTSALMTHGQHGAEVLAAVMRAIFDPLVEAVYAHGGFITVFAGDAFTAVFPPSPPAPLPEGEGSLAPPLPLGEGEGGEGMVRAIAAASAIRDHMAAHPTHETTYGVFTVACKIGLAAGEVRWGILRSQDDTRAAFYFRGPAIDGCAAAQKHAQVGEVVLHPATRSLLAGMVNAMALPDGYARLVGVVAPLPAPEPVVPPSADPAVLERFFPPGIVSSELTGEFRQAINVFIGLEGDPDPATLNAFMHSVFKLQDKYGGLLNRIDFGDKGCSLLLFWGAPVSHENDVLRALNFVLDLHDVAHVRIRAGVTSRISHAGFIGSVLQEEYTCYGNGVNLAARLMTSAPWESIWVDEPVQLRAAHQFEMEREGLVSFKGFDEPQAIYALLGLRAAAVLDFFERQMVGRQAEIARLREFVQPLFEQRQTISEVSSPVRRYAGILVVTGEAGIGKSRLVHDFLTGDSGLRPEAGSQGAEGGDQVQVFLCQTDQIVRQSLNPFRYWLRGYFGQSNTQSEAYNKRVFSRRLARLLGATGGATLRRELERMQSVLGALVDLHWEGSLYEQLDPQSRYESSFAALKTLILAESLRQPVILLLEDVHWLDDDSKQFIRRLAQDVDLYPLAILAAARPEQDVVFFGPGVEYETIALTSLAPEDLAILATSILSGPPGPRLLSLVIERSGGNPFFAEQILFYLRDEGLLEPRDQGWGVSEEALRAAPLPTNVRAIFIARLDRLAHDVREVVQTASVLGREFEVRVLSSMLQDQAVHGRIEHAEQAAVWTAISEIRYLFKHVLLRDAAYDMQVRARRATLHRQAAATLEELYADDLAPHQAELAYQYEAAYLSGLQDAAEPARVYLTRAGEQAFQRYENASAIDYFNRAFALTAEDDTAARFELLKQRELVYHNMGDREPQRADLAAMQSLAEATQNIQWQMHVQLRWAVFFETISDYAGEAEHAQKLIALAHPAGAVEMEVEGVFEWGTSLYRSGQMSEAAEKLEQARNMAQTANLPRLQADALLIWSYASEVQGKPDLARDQLDEALVLYQAAGNRFGEMNVYNTLGILDYNSGRYAGALANFSLAADMARELGRRLALSRFIGNMGYAATGLRDFATARSLTDESIRIFRDIGHTNGVAIAQVNLGIIDIREGDYSRAAADLATAIAIGREVEDFVAVAEALGFLTLATTLAGDHTSALAPGQEALELARKVEDKQHEALALLAVGHAQTALGDYAAAAESYRAAQALRQELGQEAAALEASAGLARVALAQGDLPAALAEIQPVATRLLPFMHIDRVPLITQLPNYPITQSSPHGLDGAEDPLWLWLTWFRVLEAAGDPAATQVIERAHALMLAQAERMPDAGARQRFLEGIPYLCAIAAAHRSVLGFEEAGALAEEAPAPAAPAVHVIEPGADLTRADLHAQDLAGANLRAAILVAANLRGADLSGANLRGADLSQANLRGADLTHADLRGAVLAGADLRGADFTSAQLRGADLTEAIHDASTIWPAGFDPSLT